MNNNTNIGRVVSICLAVSLILIGASTLIHNITNKQKKSIEHATFIAARWHSVGAKWDGNKLISYPDSLQKMEIIVLPNKELSLEKASDWITTSFYSKDRDGGQPDYDSRFVYKTSNELVEYLKKENSNLLVIDPTQQNDIYAKLTDCLLLITKDPSKTELPNGYQYLEDGDTRYRFQIYKVQNVGNQQFGFFHTDENGNSKNIVVNVNVTK